MKAFNRLAVMILVCALAGTGMIGCNTFRGAGKDIQSGGKAVENAANDVQHPQHQSSTITASAQSGGSISPSGVINAPYRSSRTFTIRAARGYHVADVLVDGKSVGPVTRFTFDSVVENHTISASFAVNLHR